MLPHHKAAANRQFSGIEIIDQPREPSKQRLQQAHLDQSAANHAGVEEQGQRQRAPREKQKTGANGAAIRGRANPATTGGIMKKTKRNETTKNLEREKLLPGAGGEHRAQGQLDVATEDFEPKAAPRRRSCSDPTVPHPKQHRRTVQIMERVSERDAEQSPFQDEGGVHQEERAEEENAAARATGTGFPDAAKKAPKLSVVIEAAQRGRNRTTTGDQGRSTKQGGNTLRGSLTGRETVQHGVRPSTSDSNDDEHNAAAPRATDLPRVRRTTAVGVDGRPSMRRMRRSRSTQVLIYNRKSICINSEIVIPSFENSGQIFGDYEFDRSRASKLGAGAFGKVCIVRSKRSGFKRACKKVEMASRQDHELISLEIEAMKSLDHPNVCRLYRCYYEGGAGAGNPASGGGKLNGGGGVAAPRPSVAAASGQPACGSSVSLVMELCTEGTLQDAINKALDDSSRRRKKLMLAGGEQHAGGRGGALAMGHHLTTPRGAPDAKG
ncbi:unnamed protein product, partial [Amoebophrya sp. A25]|eukprot:GSA25T00005977001.1